MTTYIYKLRLSETDMMVCKKRRNVTMTLIKEVCIKAQMCPHISIVK